MFKNIVWSAETYPLGTFLENFHLPQMVQVEDGIYSNDEAKTLSAGQILTLHCTKRSDKVLVKATAEEKRYFIPVNCPCKVKILPTNCEDVYYSVRDIIDDSSVKFIRVVHDGPPSLGIKAGDVLELKNTVEENHQKFIECEFYDKTQDLVRLPLEFKAAFEPLARPEEYHLPEVLNTFTLPVRVKFTSGNTKIQDALNSEVDLLSLDLDSVLLKAVQEETTIIATSRGGNAVSVLMIPTNSNVNVRPALGAMTGDEMYTRFCSDIHDGADLEKVNFSLANIPRLRSEPDVTVLYEYEEMSPPVPLRCIDAADGYVEVPPGRAPKHHSSTSPPISPNQTPLQQAHQDKEVNKGHNHPPPLSLRNLTRQQSAPISPRCSASSQPESDGADFNYEYVEVPPRSSPAKLHNSTFPPASPKQKSPRRSQQDMEVTEVYKGPTENIPSWTDNSPSPLSLRTLSLQQCVPVPPRCSVSSQAASEGPYTSKEYVEAPPNTPSWTSLPTSPKQTTQQPQQDEEEAYKGPIDEKTPSRTDNHPLPLPLRTLSLPRSNLKTTDSGVDNNDDNMASYENSASCKVDLTQLPPARDLHNLKTAESDTDNNNNDFDEDNVFSDALDDEDLTSDHIYSYPFVPDIKKKDISPRAPQENPHRGRKSSIKKRLSGFLRNAAPRLSRTAESLSNLFRDTPGDNVSDKQPSPTTPTEWPIVATSPSTLLNQHQRFPDDLSCLSVSEVGECLTKLNMKAYVDTFESNLIDGELFLVLNEELLWSLGVGNAFERKKLLKFIQGWRPKTD